MKKSKVTKKVKKVDATKTIKSRYNMKFNTKTITQILLVLFTLALVLIIGCTRSINNGNVQEVENPDVLLSYNDGLLDYTAIIEKPTPCHMIDVEEQIMQTRPQQIQIRVILIPNQQGTACTQVIAYETIRGQMNLTERPGRVSMTVDDKIIFSTNMII